MILLLRELERLPVEAAVDDGGAVAPLPTSSGLDTAGELGVRRNDDTEE